MPGREERRLRQLLGAPYRHRASVTTLPATLGARARLSSLIGCPLFSRPFSTQPFSTSWWAGLWEGRGVGSDWLAEDDDVAEGGRFVSQLRFTHPGSGLVLRPGRGLGRKRKWRKDAGVGTRAGKPGVRSATPVLPPPLFLSSSGRSGPAGWRLGSGDERARGTPPSRVHAPVPVVFPTRTISTCPSTSRPASCSVGEAPPRGRLSGEAC